MGHILHSSFALNWICTLQFSVPLGQRAATTTPGSSEHLICIASKIQNLLSIISCLWDLRKEIEDRKERHASPFPFLPQSQSMIYDREWRLQLLLTIFLQLPACLYSRQAAPQKQLLFFLRDSTGSNARHHDVQKQSSTSITYYHRPSS